MMSIHNISNDIGNPCALRKVMELREALWELMGLAQSSEEGDTIRRWARSGAMLANMLTNILKLLTLLKRTHLWMTVCSAPTHWKS